MQEQITLEQKSILKVFFFSEKENKGKSMHCHEIEACLSVHRLYPKESPCLANVGTPVFDKMDDANFQKNLQYSFKFQLIDSARS